MQLGSVLSSLIKFHIKVDGQVSCYDRDMFSSICTSVVTTTTCESMQSKSMNLNIILNLPGKWLSASARFLLMPTAAAWYYQEQEDCLLQVNTQ